MTKLTLPTLASLALLSISVAHGQPEATPSKTLRSHVDAPENIQAVPNTDVGISRVIARGGHQIRLQLPRRSGGKDPRFEQDFALTTQFEVKHFTNEFPSVTLYPRTGKEIYVTAAGHTADRITATFHFQNISVSDFAHNPELSVTLYKNPYDLSNRMPYLEIVAVDPRGEELVCYRPIAGEVTFGTHKIQLFTGRLPSC
jgi:hypothetical protein